MSSADMQMEIPLAPLRAPVPLPAPALIPAPVHPQAATTCKTYSTYSPTPSELEIHRNFYTKIQGWTGHIRPASTNSGGQSMVWSEPEQQQGLMETRAEVQRRRAGSPTPSNPHPLPAPARVRPEPTPVLSARDVQTTASPPAKPSVAIRDVQRDPSKPKLVAAVASGPPNSLAVPKYRPNATPALSRPASNGSGLSSQRSLRDAYLAEALATPELEIIPPGEAQRQGSTRARTKSAQKSVANRSSSRVVSGLVHASATSKAATRSATTRVPASAARQASAAQPQVAKSGLERSATVPQHQRPSNGTAATSANFDAQDPQRRQSTKAPSSQKPQTVFRTTEPGPGMAIQQPIPSRHAQPLLTPAFIPLPSSRPTLQSNTHHSSSAGPKAAPSRQAQTLLTPAFIPLPSFRPTMHTHQSSSSIFPGSALGGKTLGRKHRDISTNTLQARFEPAVYPLPPSASSATTILPLQADMEAEPLPRRNDEPLQEKASRKPSVRSAGYPEEVVIVKHERSRRSGTKYLPVRVPPQTDDHFSFDVPQGNNRRLHISLAWLKDSTATPKMSVVSSPDVGPPVPAKPPEWQSVEEPPRPALAPLPALNRPYQHIENTIRQPYPEPYPQPPALFNNLRSRLPYQQASEMRPLSPLAPFLASQRRMGPYPESIDSFPSEVPPMFERPAFDLPRADMYKPAVQPGGRDHIDNAWQGPPGPVTRFGPANGGILDLGPEDSRSRVSQGYRPAASRVGLSAKEGPAPVLPFASPRRLWDELRGFGSRGPPAATAALSRMNRNEDMLYGGQYQPTLSGFQQRDRFDWSRSRVSATRVDRLEQREREDRLRADRDWRRRDEAERRRRERRATRAEEKARRAEKRRLRRVDRENRMVARGQQSRRFDFSRAKRGVPAPRETQRGDVLRPSRAERRQARAADQQQIPKIPWRERVKLQRQPASIYKPSTGRRRAAAPAPAHHYETSQGAASNQVAQWRRAQSKLDSPRVAARNDSGKQNKRSSWNILKPITKSPKKWFEA